jgi:hypothetical protein
LLTDSLSEYEYPTPTGSADQMYALMRDQQLTIKEENVGDRVPGEVVVCDILAFVCYVASSELCLLALIEG